MKNLKILARNAKVGDGCFWIHPESINYNLIFSGINKDWLQYKAVLGESHVTTIREAGDTRRGVYNNAKTLFGTKINVHPIFKEYKYKSNMTVLKEMSDLEIAMWYLDDGCCIERRDNKKDNLPMSYRYFLCIGNFCKENPDTEREFLDHMKIRFSKLVGNNIGNIKLNNSKASAKNKTWNMPVAIGRKLVQLAATLEVEGFDNKLRFRA